MADDSIVPEPEHHDPDAASVTGLQGDLDALHDELRLLHAALDDLTQDLADHRDRLGTGEAHTAERMPVTVWPRRRARRRGALAQSPEEDVGPKATDRARRPRSLPTAATAIRRVRAWDTSTALPVNVGRWWEGALIGAVVLIAAWLRFDHLASLPPGLHGDEGVWGLEARRILRDSWIGPYSLSAAGTAAGTMYLTAIPVWLLGNTIVAVRLIPALMGTLSVLAFYLVLRRSLGMEVALAGSALLAVMSWTVHFSRIGYSCGTVPLIVVASTGALVEAIRRDRWGWWAATGALLGLNVYVYNANLLFVAVALIFALFHLYRWEVIGPLATLALFLLHPNFVTMILVAGGIVVLLRSDRIADRSKALRVGTMGGALVIVMIPMLLFALVPDSGYFNHFRDTSLFESQTWLDRDGLASRSRLLIGDYLHLWRRVCCRPEPDFVDGSGTTPLVPLAELALATIGVLFSMSRRSPIVTRFGSLALLIVPLGSALNLGVVPRRSFAIAPFIAMFAAIGLIGLLRLARSLPATRRVAVTTVLALVVSVAVAQNLVDTETTMHSPEARWVFAYEFTGASEFMRSLPPDSHVYLFSDRWDFEHPTRAFLAPGITGENRSENYGPNGFGFYDINPARGRPVLIFLDAYLDRITEATDRYPSGSVVRGGSPDDPTFIAYLLPADGLGRAPLPGG